MCRCAMTTITLNTVAVVLESSASSLLAWTDVELAMFIDGPLYDVY